MRPSRRGRSARCPCSLRLATAALSSSMVSGVSVIPALSKDPGCRRSRRAAPQSGIAHTLSWYVSACERALGDLALGVVRRRRSVRSISWPALTIAVILPPPRCRKMSGASPAFRARLQLPVHVLVLDRLHLDRDAGVLLLERGDRVLPELLAGTGRRVLPERHLDVAVAGSRPSRRHCSRRARARRRRVLRNPQGFSCPSCDSRFSSSRSTSLRGAVVGAKRIAHCSALRPSNGKECAVSQQIVCQTFSKTFSIRYAIEIMRRRPTITDVAAAAGVSVATVSKAVNGRYGVASETATGSSRSSPSWATSRASSRAACARARTG